MNLWRVLPIIVIVMLVLMLLACEYDPAPRNFESTDVVELANHMNYIKDRYGLCYAVLATKTYAGWSVASIATVPCEKVGL